MTYAASAISYWVGKAKDLVGSIAGHATPGWANGQLWSVSAAQWEGAAWDTGGNPNSHAGVSQLWSAAAAAWHTDYNNEVTAYNNEVALANANLPAGTGTSPIHFSAAGSFTGSGQSIGITLDRTGLWLITATGNETGATQAYRWSSGGTPQFTYQLSWPGGSTGGITIAPDADGSGGDAHSNAPFAAAPQAVVCNPGSVTFQITGTFATVINIPVTLQAWFIPTPTYPH